jgi:opacity protein-like surface antigen
MKGWIITAAVAAAVGLGAGAAAAQSPIPISAEVRVDGGFPRGALEENAGAGPAIGFGVNLAVQLVPNYALYGGYSRTVFDLDGATFTPDANGDTPRAIDSGFSVGLTRAFQLGGPVMPYVGVGLLVHDLEMEGIAGGGDSQLGFEFGAGAAIPVAHRIRLTPGIGYRQYSARILGNERETVNIFSAGVGLNLAF